MNDDDEELWYDDNLMFRLDQQKEKELVAAYSKAGNPVSQPSVITTFMIMNSITIFVICHQ